MQRCTQAGVGGRSLRAVQCCTDCSIQPYQRCLTPSLGDGWHGVGRDDVLGAECWRLVLGRSVLILAEPLTEGYVAACLARFGEGPVAVALDGAPGAGRPPLRNPISDGAATYVRIGPKTAPMAVFLPPR